MSVKNCLAAAICVTSMIAATGVQAHHDSYRHQSLINPWLSAGVGFGGDELGRFASSDGSIDKVRAGQGGRLAAGVVLSIDPWSSLRFSGAYQVGAISRLNGDTTFESTQFGATLLRTFQRHEFGAGLTWHAGVNFDCNIQSICSGSVEFEPALGYTLEYALRLGYSYGRGYRRGPLSHRGLRVGVRYTGIDYTPKIAGDLVDGSSLGGFVGLVF